ncbi:MAG TPA: histidine kinase dimerization/phospho-acceptor domain-containing protein, partial [Archangium sp.]|nr:histidine kinase dimerization/phospho-acceptor domain-containing protein [Archangium sp.]
MLLLLTPAILSQYVLDVLAVGPDVWMFVIRVVWALSVGLSALRMDEHSASSMRLHTAWQCAVGSLCFIALVFMAGGSDGVYFHTFPCLPLILCLIYPHDSVSATISGTLCSVGAAGMLWMAGRPLSESLLWAGIVVTVSIIGAYGASEFRKVQRAENEGRVERARREALETLAISERRRAHSEKLATIGQLAASVMHEINNPVAFIGANLDFLEREELAERGASREELAEVFRETRTGVERVRQIIGDLRGFSRMDAE